MTGFGTEAILALIREHGVLAVMAGALIEEIIVPIPSPAVPMAAGFVLVETRELIPALIQILFVITIPASLASVVSSYFVYGIAYFGGEPVVKRYGKYLDLEWENVVKLEEHFGSDREKYYVAGFRAIPVVPLSLVSGAAGLFKMNWKEYGLWSFIGMMPRNFFLATLGWYFADGFKSLASKIDTASTAVLLLVVASVVGWIAYRKTKKIRDRYLFGSA
jgi:membrane protein DedA with SNARE-associated domain